MGIKFLSSICRNIKDKVKLSKDIYEKPGELNSKENSNLLTAIPSILRTQKAIDQYLFSPNKLVVELSDNQEYSDKGPFISSDQLNLQSTLHSALKNDISNANVIAIGGTDFTTPRHLSALLKSSIMLAAMSPRKSNAYFKPMAIMPEVSKSERYEAAKEYDLNEKFYPEYIKDRVKKFLLPKFVDSGPLEYFNEITGEFYYADDMYEDEEITIISNPSRITLFSFSVGGQEIMMMENALQDILLHEYSLDSDTVNKMMRSISALHIGYAPKPDVLENKYGFNKIIIFDTKDRPALIPKNFSEEILLKTTIENNKFNAIKYNNHEDESHKYIITFNPEISEQYLKAPKDQINHNLSEYIYNIIEIFPEEYKELIGDYLMNYKE